MPGRQFNSLPAAGPMAQQLEQERQDAMRAAGEEYDIERRALGQQVLTDEQYQNKMAQLHGKHSLKALKMNRDWNQRMTQIRQYEELGAAGTISPQQSQQAQMGLSGYDVPKQTQPNYWAEHRNLVQERERVQQEFLDPWDKRKGKGNWRLVTDVHKKGKKKDQPSKWGREATPQETQQIKAAQEMIGQFDAYEFDLLNKLDPQHRKVNQLSRAMAMGPRVTGTPGVGGKRTRIPLGTGTPEDPLRGYADAQPEQKRFETPGFKMTREKAVQQARDQLGPQASKERVLTLAKQIFGAK